MIPFLDLKAARAELGSEIEAAVARVLQSGRYVGGPEVEAFESAFADYVEAESCIGVGNGLDALTLTLRALGIGPGDEVLVPAHTFVATWLSVSATGACPVPVEPSPCGFNMDPDGIAPACRPRTRAIVVVHLYGCPADLDAIRAVAAAHGLPVIEDAAQAHGAYHAGRRVGGGTTAACWSFYPSKNLGAVGDGGAVTTDDAVVAQRVRQLANYGGLRKYHHDMRGTNSRLDPIQAAVLSAKLPHLDAWNARRRRIAAIYGDGLAGTGLTLPEDPQGASVWHLYVVRSADRDGLADRLAAHDVEALIHYPVPPHGQPAYADLAADLPPLPRTEAIAHELLSLPIGPHLSEADARAVVAAVNAVV